MTGNLDKETIRQLLEEADRKWWDKHSGSCHYSEHLDFVAEYLVKRYNNGRGKRKTAH